MTAISISRIQWLGFMVIEKQENEINMEGWQDAQK